MGYDKNDIELPEGYAALPDGYEEMPETTTPEMPEGYTALPDGYELPDETPKPTNPMSRSIDNQTNTGSPYEQALQEANVPVPEIMPKSQVLFGEGKDYENPTAPDWNTGKLLVNRSNELLGNMAKGIGRWTDEANQFIGGDPDGAIKSMGKEFDEWVTKDKLDGKEVHSWEQVKDAFKKGGLFDVDTIQEALNFGAEQGIKSIADMGFITLNLPAYMVSRGQEMADERMVEKGLKGQEPTVEDMGIGLLGGVVSGMLEKIGLKATTGDIVEALSKELVGKTYEESLRIFAKEVTKGTLKEAGTEFVQEGAIEPTTERIGTGSKKPLLDIDRGMAGAVGGMTAGGGISTISGVGTEAFNRSGAGRRSLFKQRDQLIADEMDSYELIPKTAQEDAIEAREVGRSRGLTQVGQQFEQAKQTWETATPEQKQQFKQELILAVQEDPDKALVEVAGLLPYLTDEQGTDIITAVAEVATPEEMKQLEILINGEQQPEAALNKSETYELNQLEEKEASGELEGDEVWRMEDLQMKREGIGQNEQETAQNEPVPVEPKQEVKEEVKEPITQSKENELSDTAEPTEPKVTRQKRITQIKKHPRFKEVVGFIEAARGYELNRNKRMSPADLKLQMESEGLDKSQDEYKDRMTALMEIRREESPLDAFSNFTATELNQLKKGTVSSAMLEKMEDAIGEIENNPDFNQVQPEAKVNIADNIAEQVAAETALGQPKLFNTKDKLLKAKGKKEFITNVSTPKGNKLFNVNTLKKKEEPVKQTPKEEITVNNAYTFPKEEQLPFWKDMLTQEKSKYLGDANKRKMHEEVLATGDQKLQNFRVDKLEADTNEIKIKGKTFEKQAELGQAVLNEIQKYKDGRGTRGKIIGSVGNLDIQIGYNYGSDTAVVKIIGAAEQSFQVNFISQGDIGMGAKIANAADPSNYQSDINSIQYQMKDAKERIPALKKSIGEKFSKQDELAETETELADLNEQMKAEAKPEKEEGTDEAPLDYKGERIPVDQTLTKFQRAHLHALRKRAGNPKIIQKNSIIISEKDGSQVAGQYSGKKHEVYVSKGYGGTYQVLYHELVHALYTKIIKENKKFQFELNGITEEVRKNFEERGLDIPNIYGMSDIHEFLPEFFSNAEFRKELDNMPYTRNGKEVKSKTLLDKVMEFFKKILGDKKGTVTEEINKLLNEYKTEAENLAQNKKPGEDITSDMKMDSSKDPMRAGFIELGTVLSTPSRGVNLIKNKIDEAVSDHLTGKIKDTKVDAFIRRYLGGSMAGLGMLTRKQEQQFVKLYRKMKADVSKGEMNAEAAAALIEEHFGQIDTTVFETIMGEDLPTYLGTENTDPEIQLNDALYKQMYNAIVIRYLENPTAREEIAEIFPDLASELDMVRDYIDEMSKDAMSRGILLPSQFNRWKDKYLSRLYLVQNSDLDQATSQAKAGIKMGKVASGRKIESIIDYIAEFPEEAQRMGVVLDPELMVKITIAKTQGNISLEEFFRSIAYSTEVIDSRHTISLDEPIANLPTTFSPFYAEKKIIPYIHDMIGNIEKEIENGEYDETAIAQFEDYIEQLKQDIADIKEEAQAIGSLKGSFDKDKYAMIPEDIRYGAIAGLPVSKDLASMVKSQFNIVKDPEMFAEKLDKAGSKYLTYFKWAKVPANVFAYSRNLASNQFQWAMSGADPVTFAPEWIRGLDSYVRKDAWYDKARAEGLIDDNQMTFEVNQELKKMLQDLEVQGKGKSALAKVNKFMQWVGEKYGAIDDVAKIARMRYAVETDGKTQFEGAQIAQDTHYDYGLTYDIVRSIRDPNITRATLGKLLFTLFPTYTQKTIAFMYESIIERPFTMATMSAAIALILSYDTDDEEAKKSMTDKEWVSFQKSIPDWIQNSPFIRVDYEKDRHGEWIATFTDVGNVIPFGSIVAGAYAIGTGDITEGLGKFGAGGSPFQIVGNLINNKDSFTQRQIYYPHDPAKKAEGIGKYIAGQLAPGTIMRGISLVETRHPVIPRIGGVNSYVYSIKDLERMQEGKAGAIKRDAGRQSSKYRSKLRRAKADFDKGDLSTEKYLKIKAAAEEKIDEWKEQGLEDYREISPTATTEIDFKQEMKYSKDTAKELKDLLGRVKRSQQDKDLYAQSRKGVNMKALKDLEALRLLTEKEVRKQRANLKILSKTKMGDEKRTKYRKKFNNTIDRAYEVGLKKIMATKKKYNIK